MVNGYKVRVRRTAFHEAGHALAALREGRQVLEVRLSRRCPDSGQTVWARGADERVFRSSNPDGDIIPRWHQMLQDRLGDIRVALAGPLAEAKLLNKPLRSLGAELDLSKCQAIAHSMTVRHGKLRKLIEITAPENSRLPQANMLDLIEEQKSHVRRWVGRTAVWATLRTIAEQLVRRGRLDCEDLLRLTLASGSKDARQMILPF